MVGDVEKRSLLDWFEAVLSLSRWNLLEVRSKAQIYTLRVVIWMMLPQRLVPCGSQQQAVHRMAEGQVEQPADAVIEGRLIVVTRRGFRDSWYLFTTWGEQVEAEKVVAWYGKRWNLELDLRTLKGTLRLDHSQGKGKAAVEKQLLIAVAAYGFVRALIGEAAERAGVHPRELSFTRAYGLLDMMSSKLRSPHPTQRQQAYDRLLDSIGKAKLPKPSKTRPYPRAAWGSGKYYPGRRSTEAELQGK